MDIPIDAWDLRHLLLSVEDRPRGDRDEADLEAVVGRAVASLVSLPRRPTMKVSRSRTAPLLVQGMPLWILETNAWILAPEGAGGDCVIVDVPPAVTPLVERIRRLHLRPVAVVLTHGHHDHAGGAGALLQALGAAVPVYAHPGDHALVLRPAGDGVLARLTPVAAPLAVRSLVALDDGDVVRSGAMALRAVHAPGHTAGSTCLVVEGGAHPLLLTGDVLFAGGSGRCDLAGGARAEAEASLRSVLAPLPDDTLVLPGHGGVTTVGRERGRPLSRPTLAA